MSNKHQGNDGIVNVFSLISFQYRDSSQSAGSAIHKRFDVGINKKLIRQINYILLKKYYTSVNCQKVLIHFAWKKWRTYYWRYVPDINNQHILLIKGSRVIFNNSFFPQPIFSLLAVPDLKFKKPSWLVQPSSNTVLFFVLVSYFLVNLRYLI